MPYFGEASLKQQQEMRYNVLCPDETASTEQEGKCLIRKSKIRKSLEEDTGSAGSAQCVCEKNTGREHHEELFSSLN